MAIYVKRESAIADTIQSPDDVGVDLNQIEKDIAGPKGIAAHEEEIEDAIEGVIDDPAKGLMDGCEIAESCYMALYESEYNFNQIIECIDMHTLRAASMDRDLVLEAADIKGFFAAVKNAIISAFKKFTEIITSVINKVKSLFVDNQKFVSINKSAIEKGFDKIKNHNEEILGVDYNHGLIEGIVKSLQDVNNYAPTKSTIHTLKNSSVAAGDKSEDRDAAYDEYRRKLVSTLFNGSSNNTDITSVGDLVRKLEVNCTGEKKVDLRHHYKSANDLINILKSDTSKEISTNYNTIKNSINEELKKLDEEARKIPADGKDADGYAARDLKYTSNCIKFYQQVIQQVTTMISRVRTNEIMQARNFANKCVSASGEKYHEAAEFTMSENSVFAKITLI